jgi:pyruvate/2-oxoglutarate dehydrogenase complex dihydrolipoamide dehydrogenase (E3) component
MQTPHNIILATDIFRYIYIHIYIHTYIHTYIQYLQVDYVKGFGKLSGPETIEVALNAGGSQTVSAKHIILAVG